ncbi:response regulator transcription factor [Candidatus Uabimicrobium amorphum]|uniref:DNA-binding response regulator n=1 Tax=Uabimicrobium amorphum TaxID=2596890 RepID=A0A5S9IKV5_UABAM|nr:response regulator transcription factor [Candidatus Uabimicrobium amorphum]BBM83410.1 DNA-binding response regulator [Candidatus Uabimicrobium amorphum]
METKIKIFVVDDHPIVIKGLKWLLECEDDFMVCGSANDPHQAKISIEQTRPDIIITDISLQNLSGLELTKELHVKYPTLPILIFSMHEEMTYVERALLAGARGYINKSNIDGCIVKAIRKILDGKIFLSEEMNSLLLQKRFTNNHQNTHNPIEVLSDRELEVFRLLGQGFTTKKIAESLFLSESTIGTYKANIKRKLHIKNQVELIHRATSEKNYKQ